MNKTCMCSCMTPPLDYTTFESADDLKKFGPDRWCGESTVERCKHCGTLWLRYFVEYEAFASSGRWCQAPVTKHELTNLAEDDVLSHIASQPRYIFGGSFFKSMGKVGTKPFDPAFWVRTR